MPNSAPHEVIAAPYTAYWAEVGTDFPALHQEPGTDWHKIGSSGALNYDRADGVTVIHRQSVV